MSSFTKPSALLLSFAVATGALLSGCDSLEQQDPAKYAGTIDANKLGYLKDTRTDLCYAFAVTQSMSTDASVRENVALTNVPCTDKVLSLISAQPAAKM